MRLNVNDAVTIWKEYCEEVRHRNSVYWQLSRNFGAALVILISGAVGVMSIGEIPGQSRAVGVAALLLLAGLCGLLAGDVLRRQGTQLIGLSMVARRATERIVLSALKSIVTSERHKSAIDEAAKARKADDLTSPSSFTRSSMRNLVSWSFYLIGSMCVLLAVAALVHRDELSSWSKIAPLKHATSDESTK